MFSQRKIGLFIVIIPPLGGIIGVLCFIGIDAILHIINGTWPSFFPPKMRWILTMAWQINLVFAYPCVIIFGIPILKLFTNCKITSPWLYVLAGALTGTLAVLLCLILALLLLHNSSIVDDLIKAWLIMAYGAIFGAGNALAGWLLMRWK